MNRLSITAFAFVTALSFVPALANEAAVSVSASAPTASGDYRVLRMTVAYGDLDVTKADGAAALLDRIERASRVVCGERAGYTMSDARTRLFNTCRARATHYAVDAVAMPQLTQIAAAR